MYDSKTTKSYSEYSIVQTVNWIDMTYNAGFFISVAVNKFNEKLEMPGLN